MENLILQPKSKEVRKGVNILILHDEIPNIETNKEKEVKFLYQKLRHELNNKQYKKYKFSIKDISDFKIESSLKKELERTNLVILISNDIEKHILKYNIQKMKENNTTICIITGGLKTSNVVFAVNLTPYVFYINKDVKEICNKIIEIMKIKGLIKF